MHYNYCPRDAVAFPDALRTISQPPEHLWYISDAWQALQEMPAVAIVGSRKVSPYGQSVTRLFADRLARAGIVIVSGLAYGVDIIAHKAALDAGGRTIAVLPTGLDTIYPAAHEATARSIVQQGGALLSEYPPGSIPYKGNFVERNRLVSGLAYVTLVTEAAAKSGSLHTAYFALDQGREVYAVPGPITSETSVGTNRLITIGAGLASNPDDLLSLLGIDAQKQTTRQIADPDQRCILNLITAGEQDGAQLLQKSSLDAPAFNRALTMLEIDGAIIALGNNQWARG